MLPQDKLSRLILDRCAPIPASANKAERATIIAARRALEDAASYSAGVAPQITDPQAVDFVARPIIGEASQEMVLLILTNAQCRLIGAPIVASVGDIDGAEAGPRLIFRHAIAADAAGIIMCHNHPSGCPAISTADRELTHKIVAAGKLLGVPLHDHCIVPRGGEIVSLRRSMPDLWGG